ncbi:glycine zipper 2TM domain-containing protein [Noviherbaspirillum sedimenti]|uniref:Glycine zipper 2TM domain-containing protein n=1 Tax=Noviherbaspirillum sedimenti TaxID=2320865 RepID=A0A3A3FVH2_9BURK|nr:glycine zipper 2TM domain-containing protein [Noviherbaspirillum sedimenti]RJG00198.1 glycine zipper 2TM domain-containing protein [Noviherbaspirillum sedimenti]
MEANHKPNRIHPLVATAAVAVTVLSLTGVAAITGLLPTSHGESGPGSAAAVASLMAPAATGAAAQVGGGSSADPAQANAAASATAAPKAQLAAEEAEKPAPKAAPKQTSQQHSPRPASTNYSQKTSQARPICYDCGKVESVQAIQEQGQASGVGVVAGALLGGVLGNQVGGGSGRKLATVAGAVGGGFAGNEVEKRSRATSSYQVQVRMEDGAVRSFKQTTDNWRVGDRVRIVNGELSLRG